MEPWKSRLKHKIVDAIEYIIMENYNLHLKDKRFPLSDLQPGNMKPQYMTWSIFEAKGFAGNFYWK